MKWLFTSGLLNGVINRAVDITKRVVQLAADKSHSNYNNQSDQGCD